jgi:hypothetical protein
MGPLGSDAPAGHLFGAVVSAILVWWLRSVKPKRRIWSALDRMRVSEAPNCTNAADIRPVPNVYSPTEHSGCEGIVLALRATP